MKCPNCLAELPEGAGFCRYCGGLIAQAGVPSPPGGKPNEDTFAIVSLILGVISLCASMAPLCGLPMALAGLVLGFLGLKSSRRILAIIGIIASCAGILVAIMIVGAYGLALVGTFVGNAGSLAP